MSQRSKVSRSTQRALLINHRVNIIVEELNQTFNRLELHSRVAVRQRLDFVQQHYLHDFVRHFFAHSARMAHYKVLLQLRQLLFADRDIAQRAKTGGNTINRFFLSGHLVVQILSALYYSLFAFLRKFQFHTLMQNLINSFERKQVGCYLMCCHILMFYLFVILFRLQN